MANINLLPCQHDFLTANNEEVAFCAGVGTGKTFAGSMFAITETALTPSLPGIIVANTYSQLVSTTLNSLQRQCEQLGIYYKYNRSTQTVTINNTEHFARSTENYDVSRGIEGAWLLMEECAYSDYEAVQMFRGRVRLKGGSLKKRYISTPAGLNWFYSDFTPEGETYLPERRMIKATTFDNYLLPPSYVKNLVASYSADMLAQEVYAEFISFAGNRCYSDFNSKKHVQPVPKPTNDEQVYVVHDVNIDPLAGVCCYKKNGVIYVFDEIYLEGGTDVRRFGNEVHKLHYHMPIVISDGTASNKRNIFNIKETWYKSLQEQGHRTESFHNPHVAKRIANVNRCFHHNLIVIDPKCKKTIQDLELVKYKPDSNDIDKTSNTKLTHISDALGYAVWKLNPWVMDSVSKSYSI